MTFKNISQIEKYLFEHITKDKKKLFTGRKGIQRVRSALKELHNPQSKLKVIHIAGTSGKSSTAFLISNVLFSLGFKVGLHVSPHLLDIRERFQINNRFINKRKFCRYFNEILPIIQKKDGSSSEKLSYFEILVIFSCYVFSKEKVEYAVIETGIGGLYDATNVIDSGDKLVVLTKIGLDHMDILGKTIREITYQKAMIIQKKNMVVSCRQYQNAKKMIDKIAKANGARLFYLKENREYFNIKLALAGTKFDWKFQNFTLTDIEMVMVGRNQAENCALSLTAVALLSLRDHFRFKPESIKRMLARSSLPGRLEVKKIRGKIVILDGAHNPQKISSLLGNLNEILPNVKFNFLVGFKRGKAISWMLRQIIPSASTITVTSFFQENQEMQNFSEEAKKIKLSLRKMGFNRCQAIPASKKAFEIVIKKKGNVVITGSLYLISELYPITQKAGGDLP